MGQEQKISLDMTVLDIVSAYPHTEETFKSYDAQAGECICCQMLFEPLAKVVEKYQIDHKEFLAKLNNAAKS